MSQTIEPLVNYLTQLKELGQTHITLNSEAKGILREWFIAAKKNTKIDATAQTPTGAKTATSNAPQPSPIPQEPQLNSKDSPEPVLDGSTPKFESTNSLNSAEEAVKAYSTPTPASTGGNTPPLNPPKAANQPIKEEHMPYTPPAPTSSTSTLSALDSLEVASLHDFPTLTLKGESKAERFSELTTLLTKQLPSPTTAQLSTATLLPIGNLEAKLMLINDAPTLEEESNGKGLTGAQGEKIEAILKAMGLQRDEIYYTHLVKNRPLNAASPTDAERAPSLEEIKSQLSFIQAEIELIKPQVVIALGSSVARSLLNKPDVSAASVRGIWQTSFGTQTMITLHPSFLIKNEKNLQRKRQIWEDMLKVMEKLELPISLKQKRFFLKTS